MLKKPKNTTEGHPPSLREEDEEKVKGIESTLGPPKPR